MLRPLQFEDAAIGGRAFNLDQGRVITPNEMSALVAINSLRSVRKFKLDPIPETKLKSVLESASKAAPKAILNYGNA
jgi:hypothetical protein